MSTRENICLIARTSLLENLCDLYMFMSFDSSIVLIMVIHQAHSVLLGVRMIALYGLHFDLPPLHEFKGKNEIVSLLLQSSFHICLQWHSVLSHQIYTRLAVCNYLSFTFRSGELASPLMSIFPCSITSYFFHMFIFPCIIAVMLFTQMGSFSMFCHLLSKCLCLFFQFFFSFCQAQSHAIHLTVIMCCSIICYSSECVFCHAPSHATFIHLNVFILPFSITSYSSECVILPPSSITFFSIRATLLIVIVCHSIKHIITQPPIYGVIVYFCYGMSHWTIPSVNKYDYRLTLYHGHGFLLHC